MEQRSITRLRDNLNDPRSELDRSDCNLRLVWSLMKQEIEVSIAKSGFRLAKRNATFESHLDDISSWKCSRKCKSLQFERKTIDRKDRRIRTHDPDGPVYYPNH